MKDYLEKRREELKKRGVKGFTLMEMLIVVAIIAVLIAIAIPVFTSQLESSRDSVSVANLRSAYSEAATAVLASNGKAVPKATGGHITVAAPANDKQAVTVEGISFQGTATGFSGQDKNLPFTANPATLLGDNSAQGGTAGNATATFTFDLKNNTCELTALSVSTTS